MLLFYSQVFKKCLNKVVLFHIQMTTGLIMSIAITLALGMLLVPAIGTVAFAENMTGKDKNMTGMASNMTGMTGNMTSNMSGMAGNLTG
jgi:hypothetical protein